MSDITADQLKKDEAEREANFNAELSQARDPHGYGDPEPAPQPAPPPPEDKLATLLGIAETMIAGFRHLAAALPQHGYLRLLADQMEARLVPHRPAPEEPAPVVVAPAPEVVTNG